MLQFVLIALIVALVIVQTISLKNPLKYIGLTYDTDLKLSEPGELVKLRYNVYNRGRLPVFFLGVTFSFDDTVKIEKSSTGSIETTFLGKSCSKNFFLMPGAHAKGTIEFSLSSRGIHKIGLHYLEAGDFLGLSSYVQSYEPEVNLVCTAKLAERDPQVMVRGGLSGDISVKRFILEDPSLVSGYREYTGTEPLKRISWLQTVKKGNLMVKVNDYTIDVNVTVALNMEKTGSTDKEIEKCLELTRSVCEALEDMKIPYTFITNGDILSLEKGLGRKHLLALLKGLGLSKCACYEGFGALAEKCMENAAENSGCIIITSELTPDGEKALERLKAVSSGQVLVLRSDREEEE